MTTYAHAFAGAEHVDRMRDRMEAASERFSGNPLCR